MGSLIDTSIFIESERGRLDLDRHLASRLEDDFFMSVITASELLIGVHRTAPKFRIAREARIERWIEQFTVLEIDLAVARSHAVLLASLQTKGEMIGPHDVWLAATCLSRGLSMVTAKVREFSRVPDLEVENWAGNQ